MGLDRVGMERNGGTGMIPLQLGVLIFFVAVLVGGWGGGIGEMFRGWSKDVARCGGILGRVR